MLHIRNTHFCSHFWLFGHLARLSQGGRYIFERNHMQPEKPLRTILHDFAHRICIRLAGFKWAKAAIALGHESSIRQHAESRAQRSCMFHVKNPQKNLSGIFNPRYELRDSSPDFRSFPKEGRRQRYRMLIRSLERSASNQLAVVISAEELSVYITHCQRCVIV